MKKIKDIEAALLNFEEAAIKYTEATEQGDFKVEKKRINTMNDNNIFGCFVSVTSGPSEIEQKKASELGSKFREYIWGIDGFSETIKKIQYEDYGKDLVLILFQFYINPLQYILQNLKELESYRKKEKSIGVPIIINDENFFAKSEKERFEFLRSEVLRKMDLLKETVVKKKLDTKIHLLRQDLEELITNYINEKLI